MIRNLGGGGGGARGRVSRSGLSYLGVTEGLEAQSLTGRRAGVYRFPLDLVFQVCWILHRLHLLEPQGLKGGGLKLHDMQEAAMSFKKA